MATSRQKMKLAHPIARIRAWTVLPYLMLAAGCGIAVSSHAAASSRDDPAADASRWTVTASKDGAGCFLSRTYDRTGETTLLLGLDADGANHLSVLNGNWSIKPKDRLKLDFRLSNGGYAKHFAVGMTADGKQGFVTSFEKKFPSYFATSKFLHISRGKVPVERLNLDGSGAAVTDLRRCVEAQRRKPAGAKAQPDDIPQDPFAPVRKRPSRE